MGQASSTILGQDLKNKTKNFPFTLYIWIYIYSFFSTSTCDSHVLLTHTENVLSIPWHRRSTKIKRPCEYEYYLTTKPLYSPKPLWSVAGSFGWGERGQPSSSRKMLGNESLHSYIQHQRRETELILFNNKSIVNNSFEDILTKTWTFIVQSFQTNILLLLVAPEL